MVTGLMVVVFYWIMQALGLSAVTRHWVSPFWGMQAANCFLLFAGIIVHKKNKN
jgi:lipopolysaccharide export LptBFGC system permease protein LptF